jgi:hypothetical protein
MMKTMSA